MKDCQKIKLKGGSLSGTYLIHSPGQIPIVRKEVSLTQNREYGFQRWYSQLKRLQRYSVLFPGVFPQLLNYGIKQDEGIAYFDLEYIEKSTTVNEFLINTTDKIKIQNLFHGLLKTMNRLHRIKIKSTKAPLELYIYEEIEQKINACLNNHIFAKFVENEFVYFNGQKIPSLLKEMNSFKNIASNAFKNTSENFTHGNLTLENILYQPDKGRIVFIDPYEENIFDNVFSEYSQIYQSSNSKYEIYNSLNPLIDGNRVSLHIPDYEGLDYFNKLFTDFLISQYTADDIILIKLLEVSQYARMLPFKMAIAPDKMLFFYALGSYLFHRLKENQ